MATELEIARARRKTANAEYARADFAVIAAEEARRAADTARHRAHLEVAKLELAQVAADDPEWEVCGEFHIRKRVGAVTVTLGYPDDIAGYSVGPCRADDTGLRLPDYRRWPTIESALARAAIIFKHGNMEG